MVLKIVLEAKSPDSCISFHTKFFNRDAYFLSLTNIHKDSSIELGILKGKNKSSATNGRSSLPLKFLTNLGKLHRKFYLLCSF